MADRFDQVMPAGRGGRSGDPGPDSPLGRAQVVAARLSERARDAAQHERIELCERVVPEYFREQGFELTDGYYLSDFGGGDSGEMRGVREAGGDEVIAHVWLDYRGPEHSQPVAFARLWRPLG